MSRPRRLVLAMRLNRRSPRRLDRFAIPEFDLSHEQLLRRLSEARFTWSSSNVARAGSQPFPNVPAHVMEHDDIRKALIAQLQGSRPRRPHLARSTWGAWWVRGPRQELGVDRDEVGDGGGLGEP